MPGRPWTADLGRRPETPNEKAITGGWEPSDWFLHRVAVTRWELAAAQRGHDRGDRGRDTHSRRTGLIQ